MNDKTRSITLAELHTAVGAIQPNRKSVRLCFGVRLCARRGVDLRHRQGIRACLAESILGEYLTARADGVRALRRGQRGRGGVIADDEVSALLATTLLASLRSRLV